MLRTLAALLFHVTLITFMIWHFSSVLNWPLLLQRWVYLIPLMVTPLLPRKYRKAYLVILTYLVFTSLLSWNSWVFSIIRYFGHDAPKSLALTATVFSLLYFAIKRSLRGLLATLSCLSGLILASSFTLISMYLHIALVTIFLASILFDLHVIGWAVSYILALRRRSQRVV